MQGKVSYNIQAWADIGNFPGATWNVELGDNTCLVPNLVNFLGQLPKIFGLTVSGDHISVINLGVE